MDDERKESRQIDAPALAQPSAPVISPPDPLVTAVVAKVQDGISSRQARRRALRLGGYLRPRSCKAK
jgi:hypothetical protein